MGMSISMYDLAKKIAEEVRSGCIGCGIESGAIAVSIVPMEECIGMEWFIGPSMLIFPIDLKTNDTGFFTADDGKQYDAAAVAAGKITNAKLGSVADAYNWGCAALQTELLCGPGPSMHGSCPSVWGPFATAYVAAAGGPDDLTNALVWRAMNAINATEDLRTLRQS